MIVEDLIFEWVNMKELLIENSFKFYVFIDLFVNKLLYNDVLFIY